MAKSFTVMVDDNFHYMDESERYKLGEYDTLEEAIAACKKLVDEYLQDSLQQGVSPEKLYETYAMFGDDPFILGAEPGSVPFSARDYASERCRRIRGEV
jgi:hypothetical protein